MFGIPLVLAKAEGFGSFADVISCPRDSKCPLALCNLFARKCFNISSIWNTSRLGLQVFRILSSLHCYLLTI